MLILKLGRVWNQREEVWEQEHSIFASLRVLLLSTIAVAVETVAVATATCEQGFVFVAATGGREQLLPSCIPSLQR